MGCCSSKEIDSYDEKHRTAPRMYISIQDQQNFSRDISPEHARYALDSERYPPRKPQQGQEAPRGQSGNPAPLQARYEEPPPVYHYPQHRFGVVGVKKTQYGEAFGFIHPQQAKIKMVKTKCGTCRNQLNQQEQEDWQWQRDTCQLPREEPPRCKKCGQAKRREENQYIKGPTGGFVDVSRMRRTDTQDFCDDQGSPI